MSYTIPVTLTNSPNSKPADEKQLGFGQLFTDHMFLLDYEEGKGWHSPRVVPYGPFTLDPATTVFHYGQAIFEGMKAYRAKDGGVQVFRPKSYLARLNRSAARVCIPPVDTELVYAGLKKLLEVEKDWVPSSAGTSLYIRPFIIASEKFLGVRPAKTYIFSIILSPVGAYYPEGFAPVKIYVTDEFVRAVPGGLGEAKTPANYAASLLAAEVAKKKGYTQVLWLDACERKYIEEVGTMNIVFKIGGEVVTPALEGSILGGMTRDSVLFLLRQWGVPVVERRISIEELYAAHADGTLEEIFGTGTAAVISPVSELNWQGKTITVNDGKVGQLSQKLFDHITGIQYGEKEDEYDWIDKIV